jgi:cell division protein FtsQ
MKKTIFGLFTLFVILTSYNPKLDIKITSNFNIKKIIIENNVILNDQTIIEKLSYLYEENLFNLNSDKITKILSEDSFIESFSIKKIYPNTIKLVILEKQPIAILIDKKKKFYISNKGDLIDFFNIDIFQDLPNVFGNGKDFYTLYLDLQNVNFPIKMIKSFYFFETGRWDLILNNEKIIKLPVNDYLFSLTNFINSMDNTQFKKYKIFDYRIKDQLILN